MNPQGVTDISLFEGAGIQASGIPQLPSGIRAAGGIDRLLVKQSAGGGFCIARQGTIEKNTNGEGGEKKRISFLNQQTCCYAPRRETPAMFGSGT